MSLLLAAALAASPSPSPSPSPVPEIAHVVTSDRSSESAARAARTTYVVTAAEIARAGDRTVADALESVPGVEIERYGAFGAQSNVGIRGSSTPEVLVLLDGLPIAGAQIQNVNPEQMTVAGIERIEVVEGGGSTLYGSGSIGGVINIITDGHAPASATLAAGSFGEQTYQMQTPYLSFQRTYATNAYPLPGGSTMQNAYAGLTGGTLSYGHAFGAFDLSFLAGASSLVDGDPGGIGFFSTTARDASVNDDLRVGLQHKGARSTFSLDLGASRSALTYTCDAAVDDGCAEGLATPPPSATPPPDEQLLTDSRTMISAKDAVGDDAQRLVYGFDLSRGDARIDGGQGVGAAWNASSVTTTPYAQAAAYVQSQWFARNGNEIYAGLRAERDTIEGGNGSGGAYSPSLGGILRLGSAVELKLNAAGAFRAPTAEELFYPIYSNPDLAPERTRVGDATLVDDSLLGGATLEWFSTSGSNLITLDEEGIPQNVGRASIQGLTFTLKTPAYRGLLGTIAVTNLYRAQDLDADPASDPYSGQRIPGRGPVFAATLGARYLTAPASRFDGFSVTVTSNGAVEPAQSVIPYTTIPIPWYAQATAFTTVGASAGWRLTPRLLLTLRGFNLLDDRYAVFNGYAMPGRSFALEMRGR